jgi:hypothetical protein
MTDLLNMPTTMKNWLGSILSWFGLSPCGFTQRKPTHHILGQQTRLQKYINDAGDYISFFTYITELLLQWFLLLPVKKVGEN